MELINHKQRKEKKMLKTNTEQVQEKIKNYIVGGYKEWLEDNRNYIEKEAETFEEIAKEILKDCFKAEALNIYCKTPKDIYNFIFKYYGSIQNMFIYWCQGLPSILNCDYYLYYMVSPVDLLGEWLEETEEEKSKYSDDEASELITKLIFRDLAKAIKYNYDSIINEVIKK